MQDLMALQQQMSEDLALLRQDITAQRTELNQLLDQVKAFEAKIEPMQDTRPPTGNAIPTLPAVTLPKKQSATKRAKPERVLTGRAISIGGAPLPIVAGPDSDRQQ